MIDAIFSNKNLGGLLLFLLLLNYACEKTPVNDPFGEDTEQESETEVPVELDPVSIAGIHQNIFKPTCANSGCHDGTFEPDFRTVESSYNTLVNHPVIKNDAQGSFSFRVVPGDVTASQLINRMTVDIDGNSGVMPLALEPDSDYPDRREEYIQNVKDWVAGGAKDIFGN